MLGAILGQFTTEKSVNNKNDAKIDAGKTWTFMKKSTKNGDNIDAEIGETSGLTFDAKKHWKRLKHHHIIDLPKPWCSWSRLSAVHFFTKSASLEN